MTKKEIIAQINEVGSTIARNSMGCSENWYNPYWAIRETFSKEEVMEMSEKELNNLVRLAYSIADGLY